MKCVYERRSQHLVEEYGGYKMKTKVQRVKAGSLEEAMQKTGDFTSNFMNGCTDRTTCVASKEFVEYTYRGDNKWERTACTFSHLRQ